MTKDELVGYVRKSDDGKALKLNILKSSLDEIPVVTGNDGVEYVSLLINISRIKMLLGDEHEITSVYVKQDEEPTSSPASQEPMKKKQDAKDIVEYMKEIGM